MEGGDGLEPRGLDGPIGERCPRLWRYRRSTLKRGAAKWVVARAAGKGNVNHHRCAYAPDFRDGWGRTAWLSGYTEVDSIPAEVASDARHPIYSDAAPDP